MEAREFQDWRIDHSLTRTDLAARLGVNLSTINRWENGKRAIPSYLELALRELERAMRIEKFRAKLGRTPYFTTSEPVHDETPVA